MALTKVTGNVVKTTTDLTINNLTGVAATFTGNVSVGGTLTYEDVTSIEAVGIITAKNNIDAQKDVLVGAGVSVVGVTTSTGGFVGALTGNVTGNVTGGATGDFSIEDKIIHTGDTNTAIRFPAADTIQFETAGSARLQINDNGKILIATTTTSEAHANNDELIIGSSSDDANHGLTIVTPDDRYGTVAFSDGSGGNSRGLLEYNHSGDYMRIYTAAGERLRIDSSGRLLIGTTTEGYASADDLTVATTGNTGITIRSSTGGLGTLAFSDGTTGAAEYDGYIQYSQADQYMDFGGAGGNIRLRIDSGGRVLANHTASVGSGKIQAFASQDAVDILSYSTTNTHGGRLTFYRSKNATIGSNTEVADGDSLGRIDWRGYNDDGTTFNQGARIEAFVSGNVDSTTDMPTDLVFKTSANGSATPSEVLRLKSEGGITFQQGNTHYPTDFIGGASNGRNYVRIQAGNTTSGHSSGFKLNHSDGNGVMSMFINHNEDHGHFMNEHQGGDILFYTNASGSSLEKLRIDSSGRIGIGENSPGSYSSGANNIVITAASGSNTGITLNSNSGGTDSGAIFFSHGSGANAVGRIRYYHSDDHMDFYTANAERLRIDSSGRLLIGATRTYASATWYDDITINNSGAGANQPGGTGISLISNSASWGAIIFGDQDDNDIGYLKYNHNINGIYLGTNNQNRVVVDNSGRMLIGGLEVSSRDAAKLQVFGTSDTNYITMQNTTPSDADGNRYGKFIYRGTQSGGEVTDLVHLVAAHDGSADDQKGMFIIKNNDGNDGTSPTETVRVSSNNTVHIGKRDGNSNTTHWGTSRLNIVGPDPIATGVSRAASYLAIGNNESEMNGVYPITFGYTNNNNTHQPAYIAYKTTNSSSAECGALLFGTRNVVTDTQPSERMRLTADGNLGINEATPDFSGFGGNGGGIELDDVNSGFTCVKLSHGGSDMYLAASSGGGYIATRTNSMISIETNSTERINISNGGNVRIRGTTAQTGTSGGSLGLDLHTGGGTSIPIYFGSEQHSAQKSIYLSGYWMQYRGHVNEGHQMIFSQSAGNAPHGSKFTFKYNSCTNSTNSSSWNTSSDARAKENVQTITNGIAKIKQLRPVTYDWTDEYADTMGMYAMDKSDPKEYNWFAKKENGYDTDAKNGHYGFIAQEYESVLPKDVKKDKFTLGDTEISDFRSLTNDSLIATLTAALKEAIAKIETLETKVAALESS